MHGDREDALDTLIDRVARDLSAGAPSAALRENIRARTAAGPKRWPLSMWSPVLAATFGVVVAVTLWPDANREVTKAPATATRADDTQAEPRNRNRATATSSEDERLAGRGAVPAPLPEIVPLAIEPIAVGAVAVDQIPGPMPLAIDELGPIEPLDLQ